MDVLPYKTPLIVSISPMDCGSVRPFLAFVFSALCRGGMVFFLFFHVVFFFFLKPGHEQCFNGFVPRIGQKNSSELKATDVIARVRTGPVRLGPPQLFFLIPFTMAKYGFSP